MPTSAFEEMKGDCITVEAIPVSKYEHREIPIVQLAELYPDEEEDINIQLPPMNTRSPYVNGEDQNLEFIRFQQSLDSSVLKHTFYAIYVLALAEMVLSVACAFYVGVSYQMACIVCNFSKIIVIACRSVNPMAMMVCSYLATALSTLDFVFAVLYFHTSFGILACMKYPYSGSSNTPDFTGDWNYYQETFDCAESAIQMYSNCYCYNAATNKCMTADAMINGQSNSAKDACGFIVDYIPGIALAILIISGIQLILFIVIVIIITCKRKDRPNLI